MCTVDDVRGEFDHFCEDVVVFVPGRLVSGAEFGVLQADALHVLMDFKDFQADLLAWCEEGLPGLFEG